MGCKEDVHWGGTAVSKLHRLVLAYLQYSPQNFCLVLWELETLKVLCKGLLEKTESTQKNSW